MVIYKITNKVNGMMYIGQTKHDIKIRWKQHCHNGNGCRFLHHAINKYGADNFIIEVIDTANSKIELDEKEKYWIDKLNTISPNGYNLKSGGNTPKYSQESRLRMSKNHHDVSGANNPMYGRIFSKETKLKISKALTGKRLSQQRKEYIREHSPFKKAVINIDTGDVYQSSREAEELNNLAHGTISRVCRGAGKTSGGYRWAYV